MFDWVQGRPVSNIATFSDFNSKDKRDKCL